MEDERQPTCEGHKLDSYLLNAPWILWAMRERPYLGLGKPATALGSDHGPVVLRILLEVAAKERHTCMAFLHAQGTLPARQSDSPGVQEAAAAVLQRARNNPSPQEWLPSA